jgi:hypothetical protein
MKKENNHNTQKNEEKPHDVVTPIIYIPKIEHSSLDAILVLLTHTCVGSNDSSAFRKDPSGNNRKKSGKFQTGILFPCYRYFPCFPARSGDFPASFL